LNIVAELEACTEPFVIQAGRVASRPLPAIYLLNNLEKQTNKKQTNKTKTKQSN
jgi:hypothetical protein